MTAATSAAAPKTTQQTPPAPTPSTPGWVAGLKEVTTTLIALVVLVVAMGMLVVAFMDGGSWDQQKDILLYALPILGSVIGYYFGRVPAERRAEAAEKSRDEAESTAGKATEAAREAQRQVEGIAVQKKEAETKAAMVINVLDRVKSMVQTGAAAQRETLGGVHGAPDQSLEVLATLEAIAQEL